MIPSWPCQWFATWATEQTKTFGDWSWSCCVGTQTHVPAACSCPWPFASRCFGFYLWCGSLLDRECNSSQVCLLIPIVDCPVSMWVGESECVYDCEWLSVCACVCDNDLPFMTYTTEMQPQTNTPPTEHPNLNSTTFTKPYHALSYWTKQTKQHKQPHTKQNIHFSGQLQPQHTGIALQHQQNKQYLPINCHMLKTQSLNLLHLEHVAVAITMKNNQTMLHIMPTQLVCPCGCMLSLIHVYPNWQFYSWMTDLCQLAIVCDVTASSHESSNAMPD